MLLPRELLRVCCWRQISEPRLPPLPVVEQVNVFADLAHRFGMRQIFTMMHEFCFQRPPETFHRCVIITVAFAAHRDAHPVASEQRLILMTAILRSAIPFDGRAPPPDVAPRPLVARHVQPDQLSSDCRSCVRRFLRANKLPRSKLTGY